MNRPWLFAGLFLITLGTIAAIAFWSPDRDWDRGDNQFQTVQVDDADGNAIDGGSTIIVDRDRHGFPFGLLVVPLFILLLIGLIRGGFRGPGGPGGPGGRGPWSERDDRRVQWLDEWHARQHQAMDRAGAPKTTEPS